MTNTVDDLRNQISALEEKRVFLQAERDDVSYSALVERDPTAINRATAINATLDQLGHEEKMLNAALQTAIRREAEAAASEKASRRRADLEQALALLPELERDALKADEAMMTLQEVSTAIEANWAKVKELCGAGPLPGAVRVHLARSYRTGLRGLPGLQMDLVAPGQRTTAAALNAGWSQMVRNIAAENKPAKETPPKPKNKSAAAA